jgi:hypothetical protein
MLSSISNSNRLWQASCDPVARTLGLTAVILLAVGVFRPRTEFGRTPEQAGRDKLTWRGGADAVLLGDSRIVRGFSPAVMQNELPGLRIRNFGFNGLGFTFEYFQAALRVLDPASSRKLVVLGVTPRTLTRQAARRNLFTTLRMERRTPWPALLEACRERLEQAGRQYDSIRLQPILQSLRLGRVAGVYGRAHDDGWYESDHLPRSPSASSQHYRLLFGEDAVSDDEIESVLAFVRDCRSSGIRVCGFRPPVSAALLEVENELSGFNEEDFRRRFTDAGGVWAPCEPISTETYDGAHLTPEGARRASQTLGAEIQRLLFER